MIRPAITLVMALLLAGAAWAGGGGKEHDRVRRAVQDGTILPLSTIIGRAERDHAGRLIEVELESEHGRLVYEIKLITSAGHVVELHYDAQTGEPLKDEE